MDEPTAEDYLGAIELAIEGAANDDTALRIISEIMEGAPGPDPQSTAPTRILLLAVKQLGGSYLVPGGTS